MDSPVTPSKSITDALEQAKTDPKPLARCPRCESKHPERHPAVQHGGEVQICPHPFHASTERGRAALERVRQHENRASAQPAQAGEYEGLAKRLEKDVAPWLEQDRNPDDARACREAASAIRTLTREIDEARERLAAKIREVADLQQDPMWRLKEGMRERAEAAEAHVKALEAFKSAVYAAAGPKPRDKVLADERGAWTEEQAWSVDLFEVERRAAHAAPEPMVWHKGEPPKPWRSEWFIAETTYGDRVVLRALPEEYTYDYKTADETFIKADKIKRWMQFPDSGFVPAPSSDAAPAIRTLTRERDEVRADGVQLFDQAVRERDRADAAKARVKELEADIAVRRQDRFDLATKLAAAEARVKALRERLQAIIDWADLALANRKELDRHGVRNLDGPVFDAARAFLASSDAAPESKPAKLDETAFNRAVEAATEAHVAGLDPHEQLRHGVLAYLGLDPNADPA